VGEWREWSVPSAVPGSRRLVRRSTCDCGRDYSVTASPSNRMCCAALGRDTSTRKAGDAQRLWPGGLGRTGLAFIHSFIRPLPVFLLLFPSPHSLHGLAPHPQHTSPLYLPPSGTTTLRLWIISAQKGLSISFRASIPIPSDRTSFSPTHIPRQNNIPWLTDTLSRLQRSRPLESWSRSSMPSQQSTA